MNHGKLLLSAATLALCGMAGTAGAEDDAKVRKDLTSVIALQGQTCGSVTQAERRGENDYLVQCESGDRYRVYVSASNRVVVEKR